MPFGWGDDPDELTPGVSGPITRENVDAGTDVIDLAAMKAELEADRLKKQGGG